MNERIEKLATELGPIAIIGNWGRVEWKDNVYPQLGDKLYAAIDLQKFAMLIVEECITVIGEENYTMLTGKAYCTQLKRHFGVEQ